MVEFIIHADDIGNIDNKELKFELREQQNPSQIIETRYQNIDNNYYVIFAKVPKNWKVLSLSMGYQNDILNAIDDEDLENKKDENNNKSTYKSSLLSVVRIYSDREDIKEDSFLKEKTSAKYFEEIIDIEVSFLSENIKEFNSTLDKEYKKISDAKSKISELESDKKYQTEKEITETNKKITRNTSEIKKLEETIKTNESLIKENEEKIEKANERIASLS